MAIKPTDSPQGGLAQGDPEYRSRDDEAGKGDRWSARWQMTAKANG